MQEFAPSSGFGERHDLRPARFPSYRMVANGPISPPCPDHADTWIDAPGTVLSAVVHSGSDLEAAVVLVDESEVKIAIRHRGVYSTLDIPAPHNDASLVLDQRVLASETVLMLVSSIIDDESPTGADVLTLRFGPGWIERIPELSGNPAVLPRSVNDTMHVVGILNQDGEDLTGAIWCDGRHARLDDLTGDGNGFTITRPNAIDSRNRISTEAIDRDGFLHELVLQPLSVN